MLSGPAPTPLAEWLAAASDTDLVDDDRWAVPPRPWALEALRSMLGGAVVAVVLAAAMLLTTVLTRADHTNSPADSAISLTDAPPPWPGDGLDPAPILTGTTGVACGPGTLEAAQIVTGARPLRAETGGLAIAIFEAAYYHARDAVIAHEVVATDAAISDAATLQAGINSQPPGTTYCARIRPLIRGLYAVEITETRPGAPPTVYLQRIATTHVEGRSLITAIASG